MEKVYLKFGKHKIDITKEATGGEIFSLLKTMSINYEDKEEDLFGTCPLFRGYTIKEDGEKVLYYNSHCDNRGKYRVSK